MKPPPSFTADSVVASALAIRGNRARAIEYSARKRRFVSLRSLTNRTRTTADRAK